MFCCDFYERPRGAARAETEISGTYRIPSWPPAPDDEGASAGGVIHMPFNKAIGPLRSL